MTSDTPTDLNVRRRRREAGLSQEALAREADCSTSMVRLIERGYRPGADLAERLEAVLREHEAT